MRWIEPTLVPAPNPFPEFHPVIGQIINSRGISLSQGINAFLDPQLYTCRSAAEIPGMASAVDRLVDAIHKNRLICVWGDFDVDGQTATTILVETLRSLGGKIIHHIPNRELEGHGIKLEYFKEITSQGVQLVLTCDTGINALEAVNYARNRGIDVIITDHHDIPEILPQAFAVVNPKLLPDGHPLVSLSGAGVTYKLAEMLFAQMDPSTNPESLLDLVALGLVADVATLTDDTRFLVQKGLMALRTSKRAGLRSMIANAGLIQANLTDEHIGFFLAPRLNALGRLNDASSSVELLSTSDQERAQFLADQLERLNFQRQLICSQVTRAAEKKIQSEPSILDQPVIIVGGMDWHGGVIGIAASRLVEKYRKPAIVFTFSRDNLARGSARSTEVLNISEAISLQKDLLINFGGHPMAAGLALEQSKLPEFSRRINRTAEKLIGEKEPVEAALHLDGWLEIQDITPPLVEAVETLSPFGPSFEKPVFACRDVNVMDSALFGKNRDHRRFNVLDSNGNTQEVIWWNGGESENPEGQIDLAYSIRASNWQGKPRLQLELVDFHASAEELITVKPPPKQFIDYRNVVVPRGLLVDWVKDQSVIIWVEGLEKKEIEGVDRGLLHLAKTLVIWTTPPGWEEIHSSLQLVRPDKIILVCSHPKDESVNEFLIHLAGLLKSAILHKDGIVNVEILAAAMAHHRMTVDLGMRMLEARGLITQIQQDDDRIFIKTSNSKQDQVMGGLIETELQILLDETRAFRNYLKNAEISTLSF